MNETLPAWPDHCKKCSGPIVVAPPTQGIRDNPILYRALAKMPVVCSRCAEILDREYQMAEKHTRITREIDYLVEMGDVTKHFRKSGFRWSEESKEMSRDAWEYARQWQPGDANIYLWGLYGTGKTYLCQCLLRIVLESGYPVAEFSAREMINVANNYRKRDTWDRWKTRHTVLLDDIDKAGYTPSGVTALWEFLDARISGGRQTLITSNISLDALGQMLVDAAPKNESIVRSALDRLKPLVIYEMSGKSMR